MELVDDTLHDGTARQQRDVGIDPSRDHLVVLVRVGGRRSLDGHQQLRVGHVLAGEQKQCAKAGGQHHCRRRDGRPSVSRHSGDEFFQVHTVTCSG
jgi:hypothetical protein